MEGYDWVPVVPMLVEMLLVAGAVRLARKAPAVAAVLGLLLAVGVGFASNKLWAISPALNVSCDGQRDCLEVPRARPPRTYSGGWGLVGASRAPCAARAHRKAGVGCTGSACALADRAARCPLPAPKVDGSSVLGVTNMTAAVFNLNIREHRVRTAQVPVPNHNDGQLLVRVAAAGRQSINPSNARAQR